MSKIAASARDRRALILLVVAVVFFAGYQFGLKHLIADYGELREEVAFQRNRLAQDLGMLERASSYPQLFGQADSSLRSITPRLFTEQDDLLATYALQQYLRNVAKSSSVLITEANTRPATSRKDGLRVLQIDLKAESDLEGMLKLLERLESGPRIVQIASIDLRPGASQSGGAQNQNVLTLNATVIGYGIDTTVVRGTASPVATADTRTQRGGGTPR